MKINGFSKPLHTLQIISWLVYLINTIYLIFSLKEIKNFKTVVIVMALFAVACKLPVAITAYIVTTSNPKVKVLTEAEA